MQCRSAVPLAPRAGRGYRRRVRGRQRRGLGDRVVDRVSRHDRDRWRSRTSRCRTRKVRCRSRFPRERGSKVRRQGKKLCAQTFQVRRQGKKPRECDAGAEMTRLFASTSNQKGARARRSGETTRQKALRPNQKGSPSMLVASRTRLFAPPSKQFSLMTPFRPPRPPRGVAAALSREAAHPFDVT